MDECPGMQIGFCFDPIVTCPMCPVTSSKFRWSFFYTGHLYLGMILVHSVGTQGWMTLPICCYLCLNGGKHTVGRTIKD